MSVQYRYPAHNKPCQAVNVDIRFSSMDISVSRLIGKHCYCSRRVARIDDLGLSYLLMVDQSSFIRSKPRCYFYIVRAEVSAQVSLSPFHVTPLYPIRKDVDTRRVLSISQTCEYRQ